ncbi:MAG: hypothetical protein F2663_01805 [Actinobacteria bacterium]|uniref:Unannotated protein n=1 Tax=freshwater metagenome TaxID=449393 RepID=A0A6J6NI71_9ZZZZ|nr:hypothetical protein [Actinomycetota bacterium]
MRTTIAVAITAVVCFTVGAASGLGGTVGKTYVLKVKDIASFPSDNFHCQAVDAHEVACGGPVKKGSIQVYYAPHQLAVVQFLGGNKGKILYQADR